MRTLTDLVLMSNTLKERLKKLGRYHRSPGDSKVVFADDTGQQDSQIGLGIEHAKNSELPPGAKKRKTNSPLSHYACKSETPTPSNEVCENTLVVENLPLLNAKDTPDDQLLNKLKTMKDVIAAKEEKVRKLQLVKMYRVKNDLGNLDQLIIKWTKTCQQALTELHDKMPAPTPRMNELLAHLQIDPQMVAYDDEEEGFIE